MNIIRDKEMKKHRGSGAFLMPRSQWQWAAGFPKARRVQAPHGARVLSFVRFAPNDGFRPQSGLVQRGVINAACGSAPFGGWRHHLPPAKAVGLWVLSSVPYVSAGK